MVGMHPGDGMWSWWMGGWGWLWFLVALAVVVAFWVVSQAGNRSRGQVDRSHIDALRILEERFARGEIDRAEFDARRGTLRNDEA